MMGGEGKGWERNGWRKRAEERGTEGQERAKKYTHEPPSDLICIPRSL